VTGRRTHAPEGPGDRPDLLGDLLRELVRAERDLAEWADRLEHTLTGLELLRHGRPDDEQVSAMGVQARALADQQRAMGEQLRALQQQVLAVDD
jgi:hypothetical protein